MWTEVDHAGRQRAVASTLHPAYLSSPTYYQTPSGRSCFAPSSVHSLFVLYLTTSVCSPTGLSHHLLPSSLFAPACTFQAVLLHLPHSSTSSPAQTADCRLAPAPGLKRIYPHITCPLPL